MTKSPSVTPVSSKEKWEEEFCTHVSNITWLEHHMDESDMDVVTEERLKYRKILEDFIHSLLTQSRKEWQEEQNRVVNSGRKLFQEGVKSGREETIEKWRQAIYYSEDTKSCLDRKIMLNHFNEAKLKTNTK